MAAVTSAPCVTLFICILVFPLAAVSEVVTVNATTGQDCRLTCKISQKAPVQLLELSKPDLKSEDFVFVFRSENSYDISAYQLPSFKNRVNMEDTVMQNGEVSVIMKNVTKNDTGTYECYVVVSKTTGRQKRALLDFSTTIKLVVEDPGGAAGHKEDGGDKDGGDKDAGDEDGGSEDKGKTDGNSRWHIVTVLLFTGIATLIISIIIITKRQMKIVGINGENSRVSHRPPSDELCSKHLV